MNIKAKTKRAKRVRAKISGTKDRPRLVVFRSNKSISAQIIDDTSHETLVSAREKDPSVLGEVLAKKAKEKKITAVVFDRAGHRYHGRVKAVAEGARKGGLKF